jgi:hypothetical protein
MRSILHPTAPTSAPTKERAAHSAGIIAPEVNGVVRRWWTVET